MAKTGTKNKTSKKTTPAPEPEVDVELDDTDEDELDELEADEVEDSKPGKKGGDEVIFGASDLAKYLAEKTGKKVSPRELRTLIRKMARDGSGRITREITPGNRTRYNWPDGVKDPEVKAIIKAFKDGELEADKQEKLAALKERKAEKDAAKKAEAEKTGKKAAKKAAAAVEEDDDEDLDLDDED